MDEPQSGAWRLCLTCYHNCECGGMEVRRQTEVKV